MLKCKCLVNCSHSPVGVSKSPKHEEDSLNSDENYNLWLSLDLYFKIFNFTCLSLSH